MCMQLCALHAGAMIVPIATKRQDIAPALASSLPAGQDHFPFNTGPEPSAETSRLLISAALSLSMHGLRHFPQFGAFPLRAGLPVHRP
jgi:hypothetical protein